MVEALNVVIPDEMIDPIANNDEAFRLVESYVVAAEKHFHGLHRGPERLEAVTKAVAQSLVLPADSQYQTAKIIALMVYTSIALKLPDNLRHSKSQPPAPTRTHKP